MSLQHNPNGLLSAATAPGPRSPHFPSRPQSCSPCPIQIRCGPSFVLRPMHPLPALPTPIAHPPSGLDHGLVPISANCAPPSASPSAPSSSVPCISFERAWMECAVHFLRVRVHGVYSGPSLDTPAR
ncbi:hypothetical protein PMIN02_001965 [Paraphaeosphaeria minitans]